MGRGSFVGAFLLLSCEPVSASSVRRARSPTVDDDVVSLVHAPLAYFGHELLTPKGPRKNPDVGAPEDFTRKLVKLGSAAAGGWACTPGGWPRCPKLRGTTECFHVLSGAGTVTDADGTAHAFDVGDTR